MDRQHAHRRYRDADQARHRRDEQEDLHPADPGRSHPTRRLPHVQRQDTVRCSVTGLRGPVRVSSASQLVPSGPGEFLGWLLPEDLDRARALTDVAYLGDVPPSDKYRHEKGDYVPPFNVNDTWDIAVAPLCFARPGQADDQAYWELFSDLTPATMIAAMQSVLPGVTVSCSGMIAAYGVFRMTFSRAPSEHDILAIAGINWVSFINPVDTIPAPEPYADPVFLADGMIITLGQPWYATRWLDGNTIAGIVGLTASLDAAHSGAQWYVHAHGNDVFSFRCLGRETRPEHLWLDGNTIGGQVTLVSDLEPSHSGARWKAVRRGENRYTLECLGIYDNPRMRVLSSAGGVLELRPAPPSRSPAPSGESRPAISRRKNDGRARRSGGACRRPPRSIAIADGRPLTPGA